MNGGSGAEGADEFGVGAICCPAIGVGVPGAVFVLKDLRFEWLFCLACSGGNDEVFGEHGATGVAGRSTMNGCDLDLAISGDSGKAACMGAIGPAWHGDVVFDDTGGGCERFE